MLKVKYSHRKWRILIFVTILILLASIFAFVFINYRQRNNIIKEEPKVVIEQPKTKSISSKMLFTGNMFWGRYIDDWAKASSLGVAYPFSRLGEFNREAYDAWIAGLECPTVAGVKMTSAQMDETLQFNCSPDYLPETAKWFTAVTLANNHTDNQGVEGFAETKAQLDKNGIQYFGHYDPRALDDICDVISMPVTVTKDDGTSSKGKLPIALCGYHGVFRIPTADSVAVMEEYSKLMPVIAMPHMGAEYKPSPDEIKTTFYRSLIDGGADVVLGDHPHWIQSTESYKGHLIVYSMGNFMFDQQDDTEVTRSAAIEVTISTNDQSDLLDKWLVLGEKCGTYQDSCLKDAQEQGLAKLNITFGFGVVGTNDSKKITKPATPEQINSILQRLNWQTTINQLQPPYGKL